MNDIQEIVSRVMNSQVYKQWHKDYLKAYVSCLFASSSSTGWEVSFYNEENNRMTSFSSDPVELKEKDSEVFKRDATKVEELEIDKLNVSSQEAIAISDKIASNLSKGAKITKRIIILQKIEKNLWKVILIMDNMMLINIDIDAVTGEILKKDARSAMDLVDKERTR